MSQRWEIAKLAEALGVAAEALASAVADADDDRIHVAALNAAQMADLLLHVATEHGSRRRLVSDVRGAALRHAYGTGDDAALRSALDALQPPLGSAVKVIAVRMLEVVAERRRRTHGSDVLATLILLSRRDYPSAELLLLGGLEADAIDRALRAIEGQRGSAAKWEALHEALQPVGSHSPEALRAACRRWSPTELSAPSRAVYNGYMQALLLVFGWDDELAARLEVDMSGVLSIDAELSAERTKRGS